MQIVQVWTCEEDGRFHRVIGHESIPLKMEWLQRKNLFIFIFTTHNYFLQLAYLELVPVAKQIYKTHIQPRLRNPVFPPPLLLLPLLLIVS